MCALQADPVTSHLLLRAIFQDPLPPAYMIQDTIQYLVYKLRGKPLSDTFTEELYETVLFVLENSPRGYLRLRQNTVYSLMKHVGVEKKRALYHALVESQHQLHAYTLLQFASAFSRDPTTKELSLEILENLLKADALDINTPHGASLCTSILTMKEDDLLSGSVSTSPAELFQCLLDCGLNPNVITYTAIIRNLCLTRELGIAWQVFDVMKQHRIEPDAYLYSTLLNGSKLCGDFHSLRRVATMARTAQIRDPVVWNDLLHSVFLSAVIEARATGMKPPRVLPAFGSMLRLYARFFNLEPLKKLLLVDVKQLLTEAEQAPAHHWSFTRKLEPLWDDLAPLAPDELIEPTTSTLGTMILGYVRSFSQPYNVIAFYSHFRSLLKEGDPVTVHIVQMEGTLVHDIVIKALAEWRGMLRVALDVVSDMLKDATPTPAEGGDSTSAAALAAPRRHPPPSVHTWSILLNGFMYFRQKRQGERILQMMREHGVAPNLVTWNTLAAGYARLQEVGRTVRALQRLEAAGHEADDFTLRAFSYLKNKGRAISQMESMIERKKAARVIEEARSVGQEGEQLEAHEEEEVEEGLRRLENAVEELAKMTEEDGASGEGLSRGVEDDELDIQDSERGREHAGSWR
ncbi:Pentatricopeptide repeat protein [Pleurostoma richardsiae]|uniref:Pentatricopeptide repeat protein n=1 Tax=Pleurostoma richardsiae TaxID=41990 RepID=A0AA38VQP7_9PEZI|nr:Pentatricopeptide repeat protein [Pleurostoma richardsiae]